MATHPVKGAQPSQFSADVRIGQRAGWIKMPLGMLVGLGPCHVVLDGDLATRKEHNSPPLFSAQCLLWPLLPISATADFLLDNPVLRDRRVVCMPVCLSVCPSVMLVFVAKRLDRSRCQLVSRYSLGPGDNMLDGEPAPPRKDAHLPPTFQPMSIVAKLRVAHLCNCCN